MRGGKRILLIVVGVLAVIFLGMQFVPVERTNPPVLSEPNWDSPETRQLAQDACFDCHSNETQWPVLAYVAPFSWQIGYDVHYGRQTINFSDWANVRGEGRSAGEMAEAISGGWMPPDYYLWTHPSADLTADQKQALIDGFRATLSASSG